MYCDSCKGGILPTLWGPVKTESRCCFFIYHWPAGWSWEIWLPCEPLRVIISDTEILFHLCKLCFWDQWMSSTEDYYFWSQNWIVIVTELISYVLSYHPSKRRLHQHTARKTRHSPCQVQKAEPMATLSPHGNVRKEAAWGAGQEPMVQNHVLYIMSYFFLCQWWYNFNKTLTRECMSADTGIKSLGGLSLYVLTVSIWVPLPQYLNELRCTCLHSACWGRGFVQGCLRLSRSKG